MVVLGVILTLAGSVLFVLSLALTVRANPDRRVPFWANPTPVPRHSIWTRVVGAVLIAMSGPLIGWEHINWLFPFYGLMIALGVGIILAHNGRVRSGT